LSLFFLKILSSIKTLFLPIQRLMVVYSHNRQRFFVILICMLMLISAKYMDLRHAAVIRFNFCSRLIASRISLLPKANSSINGASLMTEPGGSLILMIFS